MSNELESVYYATGPDGGEYAVKVFENKTNTHKSYIRLLENVNVETTGPIMNLYLVEKSNLAVIVSSWEEGYWSKIAVDLLQTQVST